MGIIIKTKQADNLYIHPVYPEYKYAEQVLTRRVVREMENELGAM